MQTCQIVLEEPIAEGKGVYITDKACNKPATRKRILYGNGCCGNSTCGILYVCDEHIADSRTSYDIGDKDIT